MKYWLKDKIEHILRASNTAPHDEIAGLIEKIAMNELYDLWVSWIGDDNVKWKADSKESFVLWLDKEKKDLTKEVQND